MRLISLELHGFKSFADRTKINFDKGMTVIVGPNGSGKSNISDAIKWVLGELSAKNIRGAKLEDIIFGGTERRSPMGFAEVSITIDNTGENRIDSEYDTITVTRRYFKSGDSEYFINSKAVRLRDIVELFMNTGIGKTGYSIVGQGRIGEIISQKSEERRYIFEEAAGISKYRARKSESEKKLVEINSNLERVTDIASLLEVRVGPLEQEANKARIYLEIYEKKKECDVSLILFDIDSLAKQNEEFERTYAVAKHNLEIAEDAIASVNRRTDIIMTETFEAKAKVENLRLELSGAVEEKHSLDRELLVSKSSLSHTESEISRLKTEKAELEKELAGIDTQNSAYRERLEESEKILIEKKTALDFAENELSDTDIALSGIKNEYSQAVSDKASCEKQHIEKRIKLSALDSTRLSISERMDSINDSCSSAYALLDEIGQKVSKSEEKLRSYKEKSDDIEKERTAASKNIEELALKKEELSAKLSSTRASRNAKESHAETLKRMEEHFEGYQRSVKFVLDAAAQKRLSGICGPVSRIITVEPKFGIAIDCALGGNVQNIVVENEESAKKAIALLKSSNAGRSTFYPLTSIRPDRPRSDIKTILSSKGCIGVASSLVSYDKKYESIVTYLLGKTFIFENIDLAEAAAKSTGYTLRAVTLDGQIINAGGSFTGGSSGKGSGMLTRSFEIQNIINETQQLKLQEEELERIISKADEELKEYQELISEINSKYTVLASLYKAEETSLSMLQSQFDAQNDQISVLLQSKEHVTQQESASIHMRNELENDIKHLDDAVETLDVKIEMLASEILIAENNKQNALNLKNERMIDIISASKERDAARDLYNRQRESISGLEARIEKSDAAVNQAHELLCFYQNQIEKTTEKIDGHIQKTQSIELEISSINEMIEELSNEDNALRAKLRQKSSERDLYFQEFTKLEIRKSSLGSEREKLTGRLYDEYELTYASAKELGYPPVDEKSRGHVVYQLGKHRSKIRELGNVNVGAIEEYASVKSEYDFLTKQISDLNESKNKYSSILASIEKEMCSRFSETFNEINENFKNVFKDLFRGGSANLFLTDPENVLTSGIEIQVAPPGKVINNLKALSGGEQVFVAIAILFAIFKVNPPPFCLLDEIESALDEVNVVRFAEYARNYSDNTQFIIISHRRGTMETASSLYGVTMQERGVTSLLSVNVSEVETKIGVKA